jgi:hypothetical protein
MLDDVSCPMPMPMSTSTLSSAPDVVGGECPPKSPSSDWIPALLILLFHVHTQPPILLGLVAIHMSAHTIADKARLVALLSPPRYTVAELRVGQVSQLSQYKPKLGECRVHIVKQALLTRTFSGPGLQVCSTNRPIGQT